MNRHAMIRERILGPLAPFLSQVERDALDRQIDEVCQIVETTPLTRRGNNEVDFLLLAIEKPNQVVEHFDPSKVGIEPIPVDSHGTLRKGAWRGVPASAKDFGVKPATSGTIKAPRIGPGSNPISDAMRINHGVRLERQAMIDTLQRAIEAWYSRLNQSQRRRIRRAMGLRRDGWVADRGHAGRELKRFNPAIDRENPVNRPEPMPARLAVQVTDPREVAFRIGHFEWCRP